MDNLFAKALAESDSETQAKFFNEFAHSLKLICKGRQGNQLCYIADDLDSNAREVIKELSEFADLAIESRAKVEFNIRELRERQRETEMELEAIIEQRKKMEDSTQ